MIRIYFLHTRSPSNRLNIWHLMKWDIGIVDMLLTNLQQLHVNMNQNVSFQSIAVKRCYKKYGRLQRQKGSNLVLARCNYGSSLWVCMHYYSLQCSKRCQPQLVQQNNKVTFCTSKGMNISSKNSYLGTRQSQFEKFSEFKASIK